MAVSYTHLDVYKRQSKRMYSIFFIPAIVMPFANEVISVWYLVVVPPK